MLQSEIFASTSGHTAACVVFYSAIRSGLIPITMPMRFIDVFLQLFVYRSARDSVPRSSAGCAALS
jgi:hypothetical protein